MLEAIPIEVMWRTALAAIPLSLLVLTLGIVLPCRPATRHALWLAVLAILLVTPFLPAAAILDGDLLSTITARINSQTIPTHDVPNVGDEAIAELPDEKLALREMKENPPVVTRHAPWQLMNPIKPKPIEQKPTLQFSHASQGLFVPGPALVETPEAGTSKEHGDMFDGMKVSATPPDAPAPELVHTRVGANPISLPKDSVEQIDNQTATSPEVLKEWWISLTAIGVAVLELPPLPGVIWMSGIALLVVVMVLRIIYSTVRVRFAQRAPQWVQQEVQRVAEDLQLKTVPEAKMVDARIAPMIWCGRRPAVVLPRGLWDQLDQPGRCAVLCHELAHLKRRDHWVSWMDMLIGCLYWWHPVVWWIRRRVREEADLCCDAWVTLLQPEGRRAYAQALLETKKFTSALPLAVPFAGLGVTAISAKRFARRLKMVMTEQRNPGLSFSGIALAIMLTVVGGVVTPMGACPPKDKAAKADPPARVRIIAQVTATSRPSHWTDQVDQADDESTFEQYMDRLNEKEASETEVEQGGIVVLTAPTLMRITQADDCCTSVECCTTTCTSSNCCVPGHISTLTRVVSCESIAGASSALLVMSTPGEQVVTYSVESEDPDDVELVSRIYVMPKGKLKAMIRLMSRADVPILITPHDEAIEVHATTRHHRIFASFLNLINPEGAVIIVDGPNEIRIIRDDEDEDDGCGEIEDGDGWSDDEDDWADDDDGCGDRDRDRQRELQTILRIHHRTVEQLFREIHQVQRREESLQRRADRREVKAEGLQIEAVELMERALELEEESDLLEAREQSELREQYELLRGKIEEIESRAQEQLSEAESIYAEMDQLQAHAEALSEHADDLAEEIESLEEELEDS